MLYVYAYTFIYSPSQKVKNNYSKQSPNTENIYVYTVQGGFVCKECLWEKSPAFFLSICYCN